MRPRPFVLLLSGVGVRDVAVLSDADACSLLHVPVLACGALSHISVRVLAQKPGARLKIKWFDCAPVNHGCTVAILLAQLMVQEPTGAHIQYLKLL